MVPLEYTAPSRTPHWDGSRVLFEVSVAGKQIACAISRRALEDIGAQRFLWGSDLLRCFTNARIYIEGLAVEKLHGRPLGVSGRLSLWADDMDDRPPAGAAAVCRLI